MMSPPPRIDASGHGARVGETRSSRSVLGRFARDRRGDIVILFGLMVITLLATIGAAVDAARWLHARRVTGEAIDAAVLAAGRILQTNSLDSELALSVAAGFYQENVQKRLPLRKDTIVFKVVDDGTAVTADGTAVIETTLLKLIGIDELPLFAPSGTEFAKAVLGVRGNAETSLEISLMLDVTGSMEGGKLADLKDAASGLIDIVVWEGGSSTSRVALVPFSAGVNVGRIANEATRGGPRTKTFSLMSGTSANFILAADCASERTGPQAFTDAPPSVQKAGSVYTRSGACEPSNAIVPLTSDKQHLKSVISSFVAAGSTAGHLGTAWAWYTLSPRWAQVFPPESRPADYSLLSQSNANGTPKLRKVAVLMTDGEYNIQYCDSGIRDRDSNGGFSTRGTCTAPNKSSAEQARALCAGMKAEGITVYTVGFQIEAGGNAEATLAACATSPDHFYQADNGSELKLAFRDIALKVSQLYLTR